MKKTVIYLAIILFVLSACKKENEPTGDPSKELDFQSLTAVNDTISPGESTKVTAHADGYSLSYYWSATAGDLLGSGATITYVASPCQIGANDIICTVKDGHDESQTKNITIVVQ